MYIYCVCTVYISLSGQGTWNVDPACACACTACGFLYSALIFLAAGAEAICLEFCCKRNKRTQQQKQGEPQQRQQQVPQEATRTLNKSEKSKHTTREKYCMHSSPKGKSCLCLRLCCGCVCAFVCKLLCTHRRRHNTTRATTAWTRGTTQLAKHSRESRVVRLKKESFQLLCNFIGPTARAVQCVLIG